MASSLRDMLRAQSAAGLGGQEYLTGARPSFSAPGVLSRGGTLSPASAAQTSRASWAPSSVSTGTTSGTRAVGSTKSTRSYKRTSPGRGPNKEIELQQELAALEAASRAFGGVLLGGQQARSTEAFQYGTMREQEAAQRRALALRELEDRRSAERRGFTARRSPGIFQDVLAGVSEARRVSGEQFARGRAELGMTSAQRAERERMAVEDILQQSTRDAALRAAQRADAEARRLEQEARLAEAYNASSYDYDDGQGGSGGGGGRGAGSDDGLLFSTKRRRGSGWTQAYEAEKLQAKGTSYLSGPGAHFKAPAAPLTRAQRKEAARQSTRKYQSTQGATKYAPPSGLSGWR